MRSFSLSKRLAARFSRRRREHAEEEFSGSLILRKGRPYDPAWDAWLPTRRWTGVLASAVVVSMFFGVLAFHFTSKPAAPPAAIAPGSLSDIKGSYFPPVAPNSANLQQLSGTKSTTDAQFRTTGQMMIWYLECRCVANFGVIVHDALGSILDIPANSVGRTVLAIPARYTKQNLTVSVIADGQWTISLLDPSDLPFLEEPFSYLSTGTSVLGPFSGHNAELSAGFFAGIGTRFAMWLTDGSLATPGLLFFESQTFNKTFERTDLPPKFWLIVSGQGLWQVKVKK